MSGAIIVIGFLIALIVGGVAGPAPGLLFFVVWLVTFIPVFVAHGRHHRNAVAILALTIFLGWTGLGWIVAMVWAFTNDTAKA